MRFNKILCILALFSIIISGYAQVNSKIKAILDENNNTSLNPLDGKIKELKKLPQFGYSSFTADKSAGKSGKEILFIAPDYQIKIGDEFIIELSGKINSRYVLPVSKDCLITIPKVGKIYLHGKSFDEAKAKIIEKMAQAYDLVLNKENTGEKGTVVDITLGKIAGIKLFVTGKVNKSGTVSLDGVNASILSALKMTGGVTSKGSLRKIRITRQDGKTQFFDLYDFLIKGQLKPEFKYLKDGDIIFVPLKAKEVYLSGAVKQPGIYEILDNEDLADLLEIAGGFSKNADPERIQLIRTTTGKGIELKDLEIKDPAKFELEDQDMIEIATVRDSNYQNIVEITGNGITKPGIFEFTPGMTITQLVEKAGGFRKDAWKEKIFMVRLNESMKNDFLKIDEAKQKTTKLQPMDKIEVLSYEDLRGERNKVEITGHVKKPGEYAYSDGIKVADILLLAGGFDNPVFRSQTYLERGDIVRIDPKTQKSKIIKFSPKEILEGKKHIVLLPGDKIKIYAFDEIKNSNDSVKLTGHVKKTGVCRLYAGTDLAGLLEVRGGFDNPVFLKDTYLERADIFRFDPETQKSKVIKFCLKDILDGKTEIKLIPGDEIKIYALNEIKDNSDSIKLTGHVKKTGVCRLYAGTNLADLLEVRGGFDNPVFLKDTYLERADIIRTDVDTQEEKIIPFCLRDVLNKKLNPSLQPGDEIRIYAYDAIAPQKYIQVSGAVNSPGKFRLKKGMNLEDAVFEAKGLSKSSDPENIEIAQMSRDKGDLKINIVKLSLNSPEGKSYILNEGDVIVVGRRDKTNQRTGSIVIAGEIKNPGYYLLRNREKISSVIQRAGGLLPGAFPESAYLLRNNHRIVFNLPEIFEDEENENNLEMRPEDILYVPKQNSSVKVTGETCVTRNIAYKPGKSPQYYIKMAGGLSSKADGDNIKIITPQGKVVDGTGGWFSSPSVAPSSIIVVLPQTADAELIKKQLNLELEKKKQDTLKAAKKLSGK